MGYLVYYDAPDGIHRQDTRIAQDTLVVPGVGVIQSVTAPDGRAAAVVYAHGDSATVALVSEEGGWRPLFTGDRSGAFSVRFSLAGELGFGYEPSDESRGTIRVVEQGVVRDVGCTVSDRLFGWSTRGRLLVGDGRNLYTVNGRTCATVATLPLAGKRDVVVSPDGSRVAFQVRNGSRPGLYVSTNTGSGAVRVADPLFNPRHATWSPDASKLAFEIRSRRYANITHVAVHDMATGRVSFSEEETALGPPSDANPCWSPDGRRLAFDRVYARNSGALRYTTRQRMVRNMSSGAERVLTEELVRDGDPVAGRVCWWIGSGHQVVRQAEGWRLVDVEAATVQPIPVSRRLVFAEVFARP